MNRKNISSSISQLLNESNSIISELCKKINTNEKIELKLKHYLDPTLRDHFKLANIKTDSVVILAHSSTWATRLRYNIPEILKALNKKLDFPAIKTVRIKVNSSSPKTTSKTRKPLPLSTSSATILINTASDLNDQKLSLCLLKLAKNTQSS